VLSDEAPSWTVVEVELVRRLSADEVEIVVAEEVLIRREFDMVYGGFARLDEVVPAALGKGEDSEGPEGGEEVVWEAGDKFDPAGDFGVRNI
jgi:hypothetical protein